MNEFFGDGKLMKELFNKDKLKYVHENYKQNIESWGDFVDRNSEYKWNFDAICEGFLVKSKDNSIKVSYNKAKQCFKWGGGKDGRWFSDKSLSLQCMPRPIRHLIADGFMIDIDFKNCHPIILEQLCKNYNINCEYLSKYNHDPVSIRTEIAKYNDCSIADVKTNILKVLNGGSIGKYKDVFYKKLTSELKNTIIYIANRDEYKEVRKNRIKVKNNVNIDGATINCIMCHYENMCLEKMFEILEEDGIIRDDVCCLVFDGLMVADNPFNRKKLTFEYFAELSETIQEDCGFNFEILIKPFDEPLILPNDWAEKVNMNVFYIENDVEAADKFMECNKNNIKKCNGNFFFKVKDVWKTDRECDEGLLNSVKYVKYMCWFMNEWHRYNNKICVNKDIINYIKASNEFVDEKFEQKMLESNLHKLCFADKYFDFEKFDGIDYEKALFPYDDNVICRYKLSYNFPKKIQKDIDYYNEKVFEVSMPDKTQRETYIQFQARGLSGDIKDKQFCACIGERNSCKGVLTAGFKYGLEKYYVTLGANTFLQAKTTGGDEAKKLSFLNNCQYAKLAFTDEIDSKSGNKIDGNKMKSFSSGGDTIQMRTNFKDEKDLIVGCRLTMNLNSLPYVEPKDALEGLVAFNMRRKFVDVIPEINPNNLFALANPDIKAYVATEPARGALIHILLANYKPTKIKLTGIVKDDTNMKQEMDDKEDDLTVVMRHFEITNDKMNKLTQNDIREYQNLMYDRLYIHNDLKYISPKDIQDKLVRLGGTF